MGKDIGTRAGNAHKPILQWICNSKCCFMKQFSNDSGSTSGRWGLPQPVYQICLLAGKVAVVKNILEGK
jgi:hypothetical protein